MTNRFYKEEGVWYIDLKYWFANKKHLAMVWGADNLLDVLSKGKDEITLEFSSSPIIFNDGMLERHRLVGGKFEGAIYEIITGPEIKHSINTDRDSLWLCGVTLFVFLRYPKNIYYKILK